MVMGNVNWISIKDRLPKIDGIYKVKRVGSDVWEEAEYTSLGFTNYEGYAVTHWQPIQEPPKQLPPIDNELK